MMLLKSFCITLATGLTLSLAQWIGAHIPVLIHYGLTFIASYGSLKYYS